MRKFADLICHSLSDELQGWYKYQRERITNHNKVDNHLECIKNVAGETERPPTRKQQAMNQTKCNPITKQYYVCHMFLDPNGLTEYNTTQWQYNCCYMPLCSVDRSHYAKNKRRKMSCLDLHLREQNADNPISCAIGHTFRNLKFPPDLQLPFQQQGTLSSSRQTKGKHLRTMDLIHEKTNQAPKKRRKISPRKGPVNASPPKRSMRLMEKHNNIKTPTNQARKKRKRTPTKKHVSPSPTK